MLISRCRWKLFKNLHGIWWYITSVAVLSKRLKDIVSIHCTMLWYCKCRVMVELIDNFINQLSWLHKREDFNYNKTLCQLVLEKERHHEHLKPISIAIHVFQLQHGLGWLIFMHVRGSWLYTFVLVISCKWRGERYLFLYKKLYF